MHGSGTTSTDKQIDGIGWKVQKLKRAVYLIDMVDQENDSESDFVSKEYRKKEVIEFNTRALQQSVIEKKRTRADHISD